MRIASLYKVPHLTESVIVVTKQQKLTALLEHLVIIIKKVKAAYLDLACQNSLDKIVCQLFPTNALNVVNFRNTDLSINCLCVL